MALPQLILLPGRLNDEALWRHQIEPLSEICRPMVADITYGRSFSELAASVLSSADDTFALAGFSFGGIVAMEMARQAPDRLQRLALLDTTMMPDTEETLSERRHLADMVENSSRFHGFSDRMASAFLAPENRDDTGLVEEIRAMTARLGADVFVRQTRLERPDNREALTSLGCPVTIVCGSEDALTTPESHRDMAAAIRQAKLVMIPNAGHMTPLEQPEAVTDALRAWLTGD